jgi:hypothetical protein
MVTVQLVFALKATKETQLILTKVAQSKEKFLFPKVVTQLLVVEMKFVKLEMKAQFVNAKIVIYGIQNHQLVKNHQYHNVHHQMIVNKMKLVKLMFLVFSNVCQSVLKSIVQLSQFVLQEITKEVVNAYLDIKEILMIEMVARQIEEINVQIMQNVQNLKCVFDNKEYQNVYHLVIAFVVVQMLHVSRTIISLNVNVHQETLSEIQMISIKDVNKSIVSIISIVHQLNIVIV